MMEIDGDDVLRRVAAGGSMDYSVWPAVLPGIVTRIEKIAHEEFPIPNLPPPAPLILPSSRPAPSESDDTEAFLPPLPSSPTNPPSTTSSQDTNKENTPVATRTAPAPTSAAAAPPREPLPPGVLPPQIKDMLTEITSTLTSTFPTYPPHTVQRLAELVLTPKHHYKSLPSYLHALDRVVHVTSGLNVYPLPPAIHDVSAAGVLSNGISESTGPSPFANPGSDEALGGALLTPIPWLQPPGAGGSALSPQGQSGANDAQAASSTSPRSSSTSPPTDGGSGGANGSNSESAELRTESTETIDGPNGMGSIETVTVTVNGVPSMGARGVGVTQGELLRQEQRAGVVPVSQLVPSHHAHLQQRRAAAASSAASGAASGGGSDQAQTAAGDDEPSASPAVAAAEQAVESGEVVGSVSGGDEDEKPHARGPEEIGPEDMGPQREGGNYAGGLGVEMQGLDVEAAVGRKATSTASSADSKPGDEKKAADEDKMDGVEPTPAAAAAALGRSPTPKREAEEDLESVSKKLKEDSTTGSSAPKSTAEADKSTGEEKKQDKAQPAESVDVEMKADETAATAEGGGKGDESEPPTSKDASKPDGGGGESKLVKD